MADGIETVRHLIEERRQNLNEIDVALYKMKVDQLEPARAAEVRENIVILVEHRLNHLRSYRNKNLTDQEKEDLTRLINEYERKIQDLRHDG